MAGTPQANGTLSAPVNPAASFDIRDAEYQYSIPDELFAKPGVSGVPPAAAATPAAVPPVTPVGAATPGPDTQPAASTPPATPTAPNSAQKHPTWLLQHAADLGMHPLIAERLGTEDLTQLVMTELGKVRANAASNQHAAAVSHPSQTSSASQPAAHTPAPALAATPSAPAFEWGTFDDVDDLGRPVKRTYQDADINPALAHHIKSLVSEVTELKAVVTRLQTERAVEGQSKVVREFDAAFNKLGGIFGTGSGDSLKGKPEFDRRSTVFAAVKGMYESMPKSVRDSMTVEKAVFTMAKSLFGVDPPATPAAAAAPGQPLPRNGPPQASDFVTGAVQQPTQRKAQDQPLGRQAAIDAATAWWNENQASGAIPANGGTSLEEFLPFG